MFEWQIPSAACLINFMTYFVFTTSFQSRWKPRTKRDGSGSANVAIKIAASTWNGNSTRKRRRYAPVGYKGKFWWQSARKSRRITARLPRIVIWNNFLHRTEHYVPRIHASRYRALKVVLPPFRHGIRVRSAFPRRHPLSRNNGDIISRVCASSNEHLYSCALIHTVELAPRRQYKASCYRERPTCAYDGHIQRALLENRSSPCFDARRRVRELEMKTGRKVEK